MPIEPWIGDLQRIAGVSEVILDPAALANYSGDEFPLPAMRQTPRVAVRPKNALQISEILKLANREKIPVTPRGGGTGLCGGCVPSANGIVLLLDQFNRMAA